MNGIPDRRSGGCATHGVSWRPRFRHVEKPSSASEPAANLQLVDLLRDRVAQETPDMHSLPGSGVLEHEIHVVVEGQPHDELVAVR